MLKICFFCVRSTGRDSYLCSNRQRNCAPNLTFDQQQHQQWMKAPPRKKHPKKSMLHLMRDEKMTFLLKIKWHMSVRRRMLRMQTIRTRLCELIIVCVCYLVRVIGTYFCAGFLRLAPRYENLLEVTWLFFQPQTHGNEWNFTTLLLHLCSSPTLRLHLCICSF